MKFLHTADLHLDSAFCAYGAKDAQRQREDGRELLRRIFDCARREGCQMILIAGDLFDSKFVSPETGELFCSLVESCGISVVVSPGNHDPYVQGGFYAKAAERLSDNLAVFSSSELQVLELEALGVRVCGYAFTSGVLPTSPLVTANIPQGGGYINIFCGHADLKDPTSRYAPVTLSDLEKGRFAYAALGHVHNVAEYEDAAGRVRYSGFAQGRAFDELGEGGVWIVDTDGENTVCERICLSEKAFYRISVPLIAEDTYEDARNRICGEAEKLSRRSGAHVRVILTGIADGGEVSALEAHKAELCRELGIEYLELIDETLPLLDGEYLERDTTLRGELYRILRTKLISDDPNERALALKALRIGLAAIDGKSVFSLS